MVCIFIQNGTNLEVKKHGIIPVSLPRILRLIERAVGDISAVYKTKTLKRGIVINDVFYCVCCIKNKTHILWDCPRLAARMRHPGLVFEGQMKF